MMNKNGMIRKVAIILIVLVVCAYLGYTAASNLIPSNETAIVQIGSMETAVPVNQENYLFIHVNDLTLKNPELISVWIGFIDQSAQPQLMFTPVFPTTDAVTREKYEDNFHLDRNKKVNSGFLSLIRHSFDLKIAGYILTDDTTMHYTTLWLTGVDTPVSYSAPKTDNEIQAIRAGEQSLWQQFCQQASNGNAKAFFSAINSTQILPDHFYTDLTFETILLTKDRIAQAANPVLCEVLVND